MFSGPSISLPIMVYIEIMDIGMKGFVVLGKVVTTIPSHMVESKNFYTAVY
jgi:hypothetical protein